MKLTDAQIGQAGVLLVQHKLLLYGIESAPLTTDAGIDLVAYSPHSTRALTIQVKANLKAKPSGGKGKPHLDWWTPDNSPAELFAFVDLETSRVWLVGKKELPTLAQQHPSNRYHFFMSVDPSTKNRRDGKAVHDHEFQEFLLENRVNRVI